MTEIFIVTEGLKSVTTAIATVTDKIEPYVSQNGERVDSDLYSVSITDSGFLRVLFLGLKPGSYTLHRNTQLDLSWTTNIFTIDEALRSVLQYLNDHTSAEVFQILSRAFMDKFDFTLIDHLYSMHTPDNIKPVKSTLLGLPDIQKIEDTDLYTKKLLIIPLEPSTFSSAAGCSKFIGKSVYTPIKEFAVETNSINIVLHKFFFDPLKERSDKALFQFANEPESVIVHFDYIRQQAFIIEEGISELRLSIPLSERVSQGFLSIQVDDSFIPLEIHYPKIREFL